MSIFGEPSPSTCQFCYNDFASDQFLNPPCCGRRMCSQCVGVDGVGVSHNGSEDLFCRTCIIELKYVPKYGPVQREGAAPASEEDKEEQKQEQEGGGGEGEGAHVDNLGFNSEDSDVNLGEDGDVESVNN